MAVAVGRDLDFINHTLLLEREDVSKATKAEPAASL